MERNEHELFWSGAFGDQYVERNRGARLVAANLCLFAKFLTHAKPVRSVLEFGANIGLNLQALRMLLPEAELSAVEINEKAIAELRKCPWLTAHHCSIAEFQSDQTYDFVLSKGVLIHANPGQLNSLYDVLLARFPDLHLVHNGFANRRSANFPQDDLN